MPNILVLNPNSNAEVTANIDRSLDTIRQQLHADISVTNLTGTPLGIETQEDVETVVSPILAYLKQVANDYDAFVIACFSDPALHSAREQLSKPVTGIAEAGLLTALTLGDRVGTISLSASSVARHWRYYRMLGINARIAGDVAVNSSVADLAHEDKTLNNILEAGQRLRDAHGANVLVLGCAGMPQYRKPLEEKLGIPVLDPTQAATVMAIGQAVLRSS